MLTRLIPDIYIWIIEIALWFALLIAGFVGYEAAVPALKSAGWTVANEAAWRIGGAVLGVLAAFLIAVAVTGPLLLLADIRRSVKVLEDIRESVKALEANGSISSVEDLRGNRVEPVFKL